MLDCMQCYSKLPECLYFYCAFVIDTVYTKRDFMRMYFIAILVCIYYICFFDYVYLWCFMPRYLSEMTKIKIINQVKYATGDPCGVDMIYGELRLCYSYTLSVLGTTNNFLPNARDPPRTRLNNTTSQFSLPSTGDPCIIHKKWTRRVRMQTQ